MLLLVVGQGIQGIKLIAISLVLGLAGALAATQVLQDLLFDMSATNPLPLSAIATLLALAALLAC